MVRILEARRVSEGNTGFRRSLANALGLPFPANPNNLCRVRDIRTANFISGANSAVRGAIASLGRSRDERTAMARHSAGVQHDRPKS
jgi:hypothetical protein